MEEQLEMIAENLEAYGKSQVVATQTAVAKTDWAPLTLLPPWPGGLHMMGMSPAKLSGSVLATATTTTIVIPRTLSPLGIVGTTHETPKCPFVDY